MRQKQTQKRNDRAFLNGYKSPRKQNEENFSVYYEKGRKNTIINNRGYSK